MPQPALWVLGTFSMTGSGVGQHAAEVVAGAGAAGHPVLTLSVHPGAFAEADVTRAACEGLTGTAPGVIYLRALTRVTGGAGGFRGWRSRWRAVWALVRCSPAVVLVREPRATSQRTARLQWVLAHLLRLGGRHVRVRTVTQAPADLLQSELGLYVPSMAAEAAEERVMAHVLARSTAQLRITDVHLTRALGGPNAGSLPTDVKTDLLGLARDARRLSVRDVEAALRHGTICAREEAPRAIRAAMAPAEGEPTLPRIAAHLRLLGKPRRRWMRYVPPDQPRRWSDWGRGAVVLRRLAGVSRPGDAVELAALGRQVCPGFGPLSRLEWFVIFALRLPLESPESLRAPWSCPSLALRVRGELACGVPDGPQAAATRPLLRLKGIAANGSGLAQNFWMSAQALGRAGSVPELVPMDTTDRPAPTPLNVACANLNLRLTRNVTLYHVNADRVPQDLIAEARARTPYAIGFLLWEVDKIPAAHKLALEMLDEIWVPTVFLKRLYQQHFDRRVVLMRKAIDLPPPAAMPPAPRGVKRLLVAFDQRSSVERKNPMAAVRAFQAGFAGRRDVELLIKTTPDAGANWCDGSGQLAEIAAAAAQDRRIRVMRSYLPLPQFLGLIAGATAVVSPHRAEGFGYVPAFALAQGVPVVGTDYSGPRDFCTAETSEPVPYRLVPVPAGAMPFPTPGGRWAAVDEDALAAAMARVVEDPETARAKAERGRMILQTDYGPKALTERYLARLQQLGLVERDAENRAGVDEMFA